MWQQVIGCVQGGGELHRKSKSKQFDSAQQFENYKERSIRLASLGELRNIKIIEIGNFSTECVIITSLEN